MFVRAPNPIWYFVNLVGVQLDDTYFAFFLTNTLPYIPQNVYRDIQGQTVWTGNVIQFFPNGTLPDNLYFDPNLVYRIEIRHGNSQADPLIYEINDFVPCCADTSGSTAVQFLNSENQISNPSFDFINFVSPYTITLAGTYQIAPGWELELVGVGTMTITQIAFAGTDQILTNPPFALRFNASGWTSATLKQTFSNNGSIWNGGGISASLVAEAQVAQEVISLSYVPSDAGTPIPIISNAPLQIGVFQTVSGSAAIPSPSTDTDTSATASVQIQIILPPTGIVDLSNIQIVGQTNPLLAPFSVPEFQQETHERNLDHLFHYYQPSIILEPKASVLTGWNFGLNPWQFTSTTPANVATNQYTADQTIVIQQNYVASATGNNVSVGRATFLNNYGFKAIAVTAHNQFGILQYIDPSTIRQYWGSIMSSLVTVYLNSVQGSPTSVKLKMRLIYKASLPAALSQTDPVASWTESGDPVFAAGWTALTPLNDPAYTLQGAADNVPSQFSFNGFQLPASSNDNMTLGIFLYTVDNMVETGTADFIIFNDVSLVQNEFAIASNPLTFDETLRRCEFYYEKSYSTGTLPGTATEANEKFAEMLGVDSGGAAAVPRCFILEFKTPKRIVPALTGLVVYTPNTPNTPDTVRIYSRTGGGAGANSDLTFSSNWQISGGSLGTDRVTFLATNVTARAIDGAATVPEGFILYHYVVKTRLGLTDG